MKDYRLIFGLSADPVHTGHVAMVAQSADELTEHGYPIVQILLVPVYRRNPVGAEKKRLPDLYPQRRKMCALAGREIATRLGKPSDFVCVSDVEAELARDRDRPNYTAETLALLRLRSSPRSGLIFLISSELVSGPDPEFGRWYRPDRILELAHLAICPRPGYPLNARFVRALARVGRGVVVLHAVETPHVASTELRRWLRDGVSPLALWHQGLLPTAVAQYLERHRLYASDAET